MRKEEVPVLSVMGVAVDVMSVAILDRCVSCPIEDKLATVARSLRSTPAGVLSRGESTWIR